MRIRTLLLCTFLSISICSAQEQITCMTGGTAPTKLLPHTGTRKMLIVYCKFLDDTYDKSPDTDLFPSSTTTLPDWANQTVSSDTMSDYPDPSVSGYYKEMSRGKLNVIGTVYPILYIPVYNQNYYYSTNRRNISYLTKEILINIDPYVNYSDFDYDHDSTVDMIAICFRTVDRMELLDPIWGAYQGTASLTGGYSNFDAPSGPAELTLDGVKIKAGAFGSGTFQRGCVDPEGQIPIICHEFGHYLFGYAFNGDLHLPFTHHHGLMDTDGGSSVMNGYEREKLGWVSPTLLNSDQTNHPIGNAVSSDPSTSGDIYKIAKSGGGYYYIENHTGSSYYETSLHLIHGGALVMPGHGILISETTTNNNKPLDIKVADGKWNWKKTGSLYNYPFEHDIPNPYNGLSELDLVRVPTTSGTKTHPDYLGIQNNYFTIGYNQVFSPWSNPSTDSGANFSIEFVPGTGSNINFNLYMTDPLASSPAKPQNLKAAPNPGDNKVRLTWDVTYKESDVSLYEIWRRVNYGSWQSIGTTANSYYVDTHWLYDNGSTFDLTYKIRAKDTGNKYSVYSDNAYCRAWPMGKQIANNETNSVIDYNIFNYPNPFNPETKISYSLPYLSRVDLRIFDSLGREVALLVNEIQQPGSYNVTFNGSGLSSGLYIYKVRSQSLENKATFEKTGKMMMMK